MNTMLKLKYYLKRALKITLKSILGFIVFIILYLLAAYCLSRVTVDKEHNTKEEITIYILTNGVHTDLVVPVKSEFYDWSKEVKFSNINSKDTNFNYLSMGWGDKGFYLETPEWKDLKASVAFNATFGLGNSAMHATYYKTIWG